jgi:hypothetical protein
MFPPSNLAPDATRWVNTVQDTITELERRQPGLDGDLEQAQRSSNSVLTEVSSRVNAYYTNTLVQYPVTEKFLPMSECLGGINKTVAISAPAAANSTVAENWVSIFTKSITLPVAKTTAGFRLNNAQFMLVGPSTYELRFRWRVNSSTEGILNTKWMSRHEFNLSAFSMNTTGVLALVTNRYVHWSGASTDTFTIELQATIANSSNLSSSVASQNITFRAVNNEGLDTYLDVMVTV